MEALMIGGVAVVAIGGYYATVDFLNDIGLKTARKKFRNNRLSLSRDYAVTPQGGIKKMAGMHI